MTKEELQEVAFELIMSVGQARSMIFEKMDQLATKAITREEFDKGLSDASDLINEAGKSHLKVIQTESQGMDIQHTILLTHAEDLYLTTSTLLETVLRMINLFKLND